MEARGGLRERKKSATRQALHEAALRLAMERGLDNVTVEAIADAAAVSRRTFSNYFSSKEEAVSYGDQVRLRQLLAFFRRRPADEPPRTALARAAEQWATERGDLHPTWLARRREVDAHPSVMAHRVAAYGAVEKDLAAEIATRLPDGPDVSLRARVLAATTLATVRAATQVWLDQPDRPYAAVVRAAFATEAT